VKLQNDAQQEAKSPNKIYFKSFYFRIFDSLFVLLLLLVPAIKTQYSSIILPSMVTTLLPYFPMYKR